MRTAQPVTARTSIQPALIYVYRKWADPRKGRKEKTREIGREKGEEVEFIITANALEKSFIGIEQVCSA